MDLYKAKYSDKKSNRISKSNKNRFDKNSRDTKTSRSFRNSRQYYSRFDKNREMFTATCSDCGIECKIPFEPKFNKPVYCSKCFEKNEPLKSKRSSISRDDRPRERYSRDDQKLKSFNEDRNPKKSKNDKFQKKQEKFYSDGTEKFYESLKEKLYEILGGKVCSSCGFKDIRALGFTHIYDVDAFDRIRRGGFASSWGKYISEPDLARKELRVLCLNCNEIREPQRKTESEKHKKKSRYFPR